jgi:hypothetical protein
MMKFSSTGLMLMLALLMAGSSRSGSIATQAALAAARSSSRESVGLTTIGHRLPILAVSTVEQAPSVPAADVWLTVSLGGGLIALRLRRMQKGARTSRVMV